MEKLFKNKLMVKFVGILLLSISWLIYVSCKKKIINEIKSPKPVIILFWHAKLIMFPFAFKKWWNRKTSVLISNHKDGQVVINLVKKFGIGVIHGSSNNGAVKALAGALRNIKNGVDVAITPDGPRGPRHSVSNGPVIISQKTGADIVVVDYTASKFWQFNSWDKMILPKPFSTITYTISEPFNIKNMDLEEAKKFISSKMPKD